MGSKTAVFCKNRENPFRISKGIFSIFCEKQQKTAVFEPIFKLQSALENFLDVVWPCYGYQKVPPGDALQEKISFMFIKHVCKKILRNQKKNVL